MSNFCRSYGKFPFLKSPVDLIKNYAHTLNRARRHEYQSPEIDVHFLLETKSLRKKDRSMIFRILFESRGEKSC